MELLMTSAIEGLVERLRLRVQPRDSFFQRLFTDFPIGSTTVRKFGKFGGISLANGDRNLEYLARGGGNERAR